MQKIKMTRFFKGMATTKYGDKPKVSFKCDEHGDKWVSTFKVTPEMDKWAEGDTVEVNITEKNGYLNFDTGTPSPVAGLEARVRAIEVLVGISSDEKSVQVDTPPTTEKDDFDF